jgi:general stress protein 26
MEQQTEQVSREDGIEKLREMIKGIDIGMLTTIGEDGTPHSRPMRVQDVEFNGDLWFFTKAPSGKTHEIEANPKVGVSFARPDKQDYVSVSGTAELLRDKAKIDEFWSPIYVAWFPDGKDDPELALIKVSVEQAEYWDSPTSPVAHAIGFIKAATTGKQHTVGDHQKLEL